MNLLNINKSRWKKKNLRIPSVSSVSLIFLLSILFFYFSYTIFVKFLLPVSRKPINPFPQCIPHKTLNPFIRSEKFLWFSPHSGFSNQLSELKNGILVAAILNRTLIIPPILDHHAVALGSCPKFRVSTPTELRMSVWDHIHQLVQTHRYVSMADVVDVSSVVSLSMVKTVDFRVFASLWCDLNMEGACYGKLCCATLGRSGVSSGNFDQCRSLLTGMEGNVIQCMYAVEEDCRTTVWTYQQDNDEELDSFQPDEELKKKKKISHVRRRRDLYRAFGPGSDAELATVLSFGSLFTAPYKGSELYIDIHEAPRDSQIQSLLKKIEFLPFVPEIMSAGQGFSKNRIKAPFLCSQLRLLDGQFKNHWKATFLTLKQKVDSLVEEDSHNPVHIFVMTDLPKANWTDTYLSELARSDLYKLYILQGHDDLVVETARRLMAAEHGLRSGFLPRIHDNVHGRQNCPNAFLPDVLLYIEQAICSCASLGFVGTAGSTIAESIELMRRNNVCFTPS
ncbi:O-fucosyltransferase 30-like [Aristolochia californica]|uniref:O-fucosyltransferase 30-like n=1 Tax=Aristolochia californica TaxID=171875 RepID=UPI0035DD98FD